MDRLVIEKLERMLETTNSPGWKELEKDMEDKVEQLKNALTDPTVDNDLLKIAQGRILVYREFLAIEPSVRYALEEAKNPEVEDDEV